MSLLRRVTRRLVVRLVGAAGRRRRTFALLTTVGVGLVVASALNVLPSFLLGSPAPSGQFHQALEGEPPATANYIRGLQTNDVRLVWDSLSEQVTREMQRRGGVDDLQRQLDRSQELGVRIDQIRYVGGSPIPNGRSLHFYVVGRTGRTRGDVAYVPYVFTLDPQGKIERVE